MKLKIQDEHFLCKKHVLCWAKIVFKSNIKNINVIKYYKNLSIIIIILSHFFLNQKRINFQILYGNLITLVLACTLYVHKITIWLVVGNLLTFHILDKLWFSHIYHSEKQGNKKLYLANFFNVLWLTVN